jgi:hypothetical protein
MVAGCAESEGLRELNAKQPRTEERAEGFGRESAMKAHEVRLLRRCPVCGKLGDEQAMVNIGPMKTPAHDRCAFEQLGEGIVNLPKEERAKFTLAVVGPSVMLRLHDTS